MRFLFLIFILTLILSCNSDGNVDSTKTSRRDNNFSENSSLEFFNQLKALSDNCLNSSDLYSVLEKNEPYTGSLSKEKYKWLYSLHEIDSIQFQRADELKPLCKLFENDSILSVIFTDMYDYKQALHVFNFKKSNYKPVSSFILYSVGGDAEDFWNTDGKRMDSLTYRLTEIEGHVNDIEKADTTYIDYRKTIKVSINSRSGKLKKEIEKLEKDIIETKYTAANAALKNKG